MRYRTLIRLADSYEINDAPSTTLPYITNVTMNEVTSATKGLQIGGTASDKITFNLFNSPLTALDGLKVELYTTEDIETTDEGLGDVVITDDTTLEDLTNADVYENDKREGSGDTEMSEAEKAAFLSSFGYTEQTLDNIDSDPDAVIYNVADEDASSDIGAPIENNTTRAETYEAGDVPDVQNIPSMYAEMGTFYVTSAVNMGDYIAVTAMDAFVLMGDKFETSATTLTGIFDDFVARMAALGIDVEDADLEEVDVKWPSNTTLRDAAGILAGCVGGYANFTRAGSLEFRQYMQNDYSINSYDVDYVTVQGESLYIDSVLNGNVRTSNFAIVPEGADVSENTLCFDNALVDASMLEAIGELYIGVSYQPATVQAQWYTNVESGDIIGCETEDGVVDICITNQTIFFDAGITVISSIADTTLIGLQKVQQGRKSASEQIDVLNDGLDDIVKHVVIGDETVDIVGNDGTVYASYGSTSAFYGENSTFRLNSNGLSMTKNDTGDVFFNMYKSADGEEFRYDADVRFGPVGTIPSVFNVPYDAKTIDTFTLRDDEGYYQAVFNGLNAAPLLIDGEIDRGYVCTINNNTITISPDISGLRLSGSVDLTITGTLNAEAKFTFNGNNVPSIVESNYDPILGWCYEKWSSGKLECWTAMNWTGKIATSQASEYTSPAITFGNYPVPFANNPCVTASCYSASSDHGFARPVIYPAASPRTNVGTVRLNRQNSMSTDTTFTVCLHVVGNWK